MMSAAAAVDGWAGVLDRAFQESHGGGGTLADRSGAVTSLDEAVA